MEFILDVKKWRCGGDDNEINANSLGKGDTEMLNGEGYMCCLGQFSKQLGVSDRKLLENGGPENVIGEYSTRRMKEKAKSLEAFVYLSEIRKGYRNTLLSKKAININDDEYTSPKQKIVKLKKLFKEYGHTIKVINENYLP